MWGLGSRKTVKRFREGSGRESKGSFWKDFEGGVVRVCWRIGCE